MHKDLLVQSPLLALPMAAMFIFLAVWLVAAIRVLTRSRSEMALVSRLPLQDDLPGAKAARAAGRGRS